MELVRRKLHILKSPEKGGKEGEDGENRVESASGSEPISGVLTCGEAAERGTPTESWLRAEEKVDSSNSGWDTNSGWAAVIALPPDASGAEFKLSVN
ncbi:hypothetical protein E2C01_011331 [Portunus trituberculatus]|uniref:Uncharacterized protein n=1 Tax=Portunus trituberculatus TaxID=210409 RepID=A0A5B7DBF4_PORTR|nr:hypothetical protein [Portunus trituberculatus]